MAKNELSAEEKLARICGNLSRVCDFWEKWSDASGPIKAFAEQVRDVIKGDSVSFAFPDCAKCEESGNEECPWYGEPDGCNNRELKGYSMNRLTKANIQSLLTAAKDI